jgi:hypothetical protein
MADRLARNFWRLGFAIGCVFVLTTLAYAESVMPSPDNLIRVADKSPLLGAVYIMAAVTLAVLYFAWQMFGTVQELTRTLTRLTDALNSRPCILTAPTPAHPHRLEGPR